MHFHFNFSTTFHCIQSHLCDTVLSLRCMILLTLFVHTMSVHYFTYIRNTVILDDLHQAESVTKHVKEEILALQGNLRLSHCFVFANAHLLFQAVEEIRPFDEHRSWKHQLPLIACCLFCYCLYCTYFYSYVISSYSMRCVKYLLTHYTQTYNIQKSIYPF